MTESELVELAAQVLYEAGVFGYNNGPLDDESRESLLSLAQAALTAINLPQMLEVVAAAREVPSRCPNRYEHQGQEGLTLAWDCADDQCRNPEHVRHTECKHWSHPLAASLAALDPS